MSYTVSVCIVLDRSGSMDACRADAVGAVNSYLQKVRDDRVDARITVLLFDSDGIELIRERVPIAECQNVSPAEYLPRSLTPLLDAVARGVSMLEADADDSRRYLLAIVTDGHENASREHTFASVSALLKRKQEENRWTVLYLGADQASWQQAQQIGIRPAATADFARRSINVTAEVVARATVVAASVDARAFEITGEERAKLSGAFDRGR